MAESPAKGKRIDSLRGLVTAVDTGVEVYDQDAGAKEAVTVGPSGLSVNGARRVATAGLAHLRFHGSGRGNAYDVQATPGDELSLSAGANPRCRNRGCAASHSATRQYTVTMKVL